MNKKLPNYFIKNILFYFNLVLFSFNYEDLSSAESSEIYAETVTMNNNSSFVSPSFDGTCLLFDEGASRYRIVKHFQGRSRVPCQQAKIWFFFPPEKDYFISHSFIIPYQP